MLAFSESMGCAQSNSVGPLTSSVPVPQHQTVRGPDEVTVGAQDTSSSPPLDATTILDSTTSAQTCGRDERADNPKRTCTDDGGARKVWADCIICDDESDIQCDEGHPICRECLEKYVLENVEKLRKTDYLPAKAETAQISEDGATLAFLRGACSCPLRGHGCGAPPFGDRLIALNVSDHAFAQYSEGKALLPIARKVDQVVQEGSELALLMPNARMCARCHYGPVELAAGSCDDLRMHHGEVRAPGRAPVSNACPNCGWFADTITAWPRWVRQTTVEEATWATVHAAQETPHDDYHDDEEACTHEDDVPTCSHGHRMARQTGAPPLTYGPRTAVRCDGCSRMDLVESCRHFFHCPPCRYDLCPACAEQRMQCRVSGRRRPTLPLRTPWTPVPSRHRASAEPTLAVGTQVGYDPFRGCTVALLHADGSVDITVPGVGIHSRVARSAIQAISAEEVDEFGLLPAADSLFEMMDGVLDQDMERLHRRREMLLQMRTDRGIPSYNQFQPPLWRHPAMEIPSFDQLQPSLPLALPAMFPASARLEADLAQAHAERQAFERRVGRMELDAAIAAAPRPGRNPDAPPTRVAGPGSQAADRARSLALLARLTGFEEGSQACAFYLDEAGGDVEAAVRAAVQGATLASPIIGQRANFLEDENNSEHPQNTPPK